MAYASWHTTVTDLQGNVIPNASIYVVNEVTGIAPQLYADRQGLVPMGNPFTAEADGTVSFYVVGGAYRIRASFGSWERTWRYVGIGTAQEFDVDQIIGNSLVSVNPQTFTPEEQEQARENIGVYPVGINIKSVGATGQRDQDVTSILQSALDNGGEIYFPPGDYSVKTASLRVWSDTTLRLHPEATIWNDCATSDGYTLFVNGPLGGTAPDGGYDNTKNIRIIGGRLSGQGRVSQGLGNSHIAFAHHENLYIEDVTFDYYSGNTHSVEINSTKHARFVRCKWLNYDPQSAPLGTREYVNIDASYAGGFPAFGPYDNTPCDDVIFEDCDFEDGDVAIGSHYESAVNCHTGIVVRRCRVKNMSSRAFNFYRWDGFTFEDVDIDGCLIAFRAIDVYRGNIIRPRVSGATQQLVNIYSGGTFPRVESIVVSGGQFFDCNAVSISNSNFSRVIENTWINDSYVAQTCVQFGGVSIECQSTGNLNHGSMPVNPDGLPGTGGSFIIDGIWVFTIPDDDVATWRMPHHARQGLAWISTSSASLNARPRNLYFIRCDSSPAITAVVGAVTTNVNTATGVMTGTTGSDGAFTISAANDGKVYLENRSGTSLTIKASIC